MKEDLEVALRSYVKDRPGCTAREIARALGIERGEANSVLYRARGTVYQCSDESPPRWRLVEAKVAQNRQGSFGLVEEVLDGDIHIDLPGGDWLLRIQVGNLSINDPIAIVESRGPRSRIVTVSHQVERRGEASEGHDFTAVLAVAASMLAWEAAKDMAGRHPEIPFDFESAMRDVYLSAAAHLQRQQQSAQS